MRTTNILAERNSQQLVIRDVSNKMRESGLESREAWRPSGGGKVILVGLQRGIGLQLFVVQLYKAKIQL
jgi:hypothetical protein